MPRQNSFNALQKAELFRIASIEDDQARLADIRRFAEANGRARTDVKKAVERRRICSPSDEDLKRLAAIEDDAERASAIRLFANAHKRTHTEIKRAVDRRRLYGTGKGSVPAPMPPLAKPSTTPGITMAQLMARR
jgi:alkanesulfonate monooxygenase SsuD/methylene tetrahydromethanopterin reductase-like flavin-dependent oxidoreductase (luciferase family)